MSKVDKLREIVRNTEENMKETEFSKEFADDYQRAIISQKICGVINQLKS